MMIPAAFQSPVLFALFLFGALVLSIFVLHRLGGMMDGQAAQRDILLVITWLQVLRLVLQIAVLVLSLISAGLSALLVFVASIWGLYILAAFLKVAHRYDTMIKAVGLMLLSFLAIVIGMSLLLGLLGGLIGGGAGHV